MKRKWQEWEDDAVRAAYPNVGPDIPLLKGNRSRNAITARACLLGIRRITKPERHLTKTARRNMALGAKKGNANRAANRAKEP